MNKLSNKELRELVENTKGRIMKCVFTKANGENREMLCRTQVKKGLVGCGRHWSHEHIVTVYDMQKHQYRSIDLNRLKSLRCGKIEYKVED